MNLRWRLGDGEVHAADQERFRIAAYFFENLSVDPNVAEKYASKAPL